MQLHTTSEEMLTKAGSLPERRHVDFSISKSLDYVKVL